MKYEQYLHLTHGPLQYALPMAEVEGVLSDGVYAPVPCRRRYVWGVCWRAGQLYPAVSLTGREAAAPAAGILYRRGDRAAVFFADSIGDLAPLPRGAEERPLAGMGRVLRADAGALWLPQLEELAVNV